MAPPPPRGAASADELTTLLGSARGLDQTLAPTSTRWTQVFVLDEKRALLAGELVNETVALLTDDGGATWRSLRSERDAWSSWAVAADGSIVLGIGARDGALTPTSAMLASTRLSFAAFDSVTLTAPTPLFPTLKGPVEGTLQTESAVPVLLAPDSAALVGEETPRKPFLFYGGKPGAEAAAPLKLPASEKIVPVTFGRPPTLLSIRGRDLLERPVPAAGKPLDKPVKVSGLVATPTLIAELSMPPACETGSWSFQRVKQPKISTILGVSQGKTVSLSMPESTLPTTHVGCGAGRVVVETIAAKTGAPATWATQPDVPTMVACDLAGKCVTPQNAPFRVWPELAQARRRDGLGGAGHPRRDDGSRGRSLGPLSGARPRRRGAVRAHARHRRRPGRPRADRAWCAGLIRNASAAAHLRRRDGDVAAGVVRHGIRRRRDQLEPALMPSGRTVCHQGVGAAAIGGGRLRGWALFFRLGTVGPFAFFRAVALACSATFASAA